jgi:hypothetical protein
MAITIETVAEFVTEFARERRIANDKKNDTRTAETVARNTYLEGFLDGSGIAPTAPVIFRLRKAFLEGYGE